MNVGLAMQSQEKLKPYIMRIDDAEFVATQRNRILMKKHGRLPSYCLWDANSIKHETRIEKITWFFEHLKYLDYFSEMSNKFIGPSSETP